ncbi:MAG: phosphate acyltransferase PlsX, partial [Bacteroidetes bacterium]|nr:phosphate acyltransferase PlsX [Bacteroidota bacterium]
FAREIMGIDAPTVGLLNVGEEPEKGLDIHKEVYKLLSGLDNFSGNVEGKDIFLGKTDIYLTDGFTGNLVLKFGESIPSTLQKLTAQVMEEEKMVASEREIVQQVLSKAMHSFDYENVGGIPFLGVNGLSLVGHGGSSEKAIKNMIANALQCKEHKINEKIVASLNN